MSKAIVVKTNKLARIEPYSSTNKQSFYELARLKLPKGNYIISAKIVVSVTNEQINDRLPHSIYSSLSCNKSNDHDYLTLNPPYDNRGFLTLFLPVSLEIESDVHLKASALYHKLWVLDAQICALSVDELSISTGHCWEFPIGEAKNYRPFVEENGNAFIQEDYMTLKDESLTDISWGKIRGNFTEIAPFKKSTWIGRMIDGLKWLTK